MVYSARYKDGQKGFAQHIIAVNRAVFEPAMAPVGWWASFRRLARRVVDAPGVDFAIRFSLEQNRLARVLFLLAPEERQAEMEALGAAFLALNAVVEDSVSLPMDRQEHDRIAAALPRFRAKVRQESATYEHQDIRLFNDFRLIADLPGLIDITLTQGRTFHYQLNARRHRPATDDVRWMKKNLLRINEERRFPMPLKEVQRRVDDRMNGAAFLVQEYIASAEMATCARIGEAVEASFASRYAGSGFAGSMLENGEFDDDLAMGVHSAWSSEPAPWEKAAAAASSDELLGLLDWRPADATAAQLRNSVWTDGAVDHLQRIEKQLARIERALGDMSSAAHCREFRSAIAISRTDRNSSLGKARQILEGVITEIYRQRKAPASKRLPVLNDMIQELLKDKSLFPRKIASYLHTIRTLGNMGVHFDTTEPSRQSPISDTDVEVSLLMLLQLIEWYLLEYPRAETAP
jgi:hypothetical protein